MLLLLAAIVVTGAIAWAGAGIARELKAGRELTRRAQAIEVMGTFAPGISAVAADARALLTWQPLAAIARQQFPDTFEELDRAAGARFPFSQAHIEAAHARWTAEWLMWEHAHDATYKLRAAEAEAGAVNVAPGLARARLETIEREKLELYQRRYEEYVRVGKALQALMN